ncbi:MAG: Holliday junction branch migration protein RuvA [Armatimonadota bacterium]
MIRRIRGKLVELKEDFVLIDVNGLTYEVGISPSTAEHLLDRATGTEIELYTYHYLHDEQSRSTPILMGFMRPEEREFFEELIQVPRFGPKTALTSMSIPLKAYAEAIELGDGKTLRSLSGVGKQTARGLIAQLQGKLGQFAVVDEKAAVPAGATTKGEAEEAAVEILQQLGVAEADAVQAVLTARGEDIDHNDPEAIVKTVLKG